jgi:glycosyltransferase involved in cell wall biosynthesis
MAQEPLPTISVVVPVLNAERTIDDCIVSILRTDYPSNRREIVVVDNASTDGTARIIKRRPVQYLLEERRSPAHARNRGIGASLGDIVAFTDADCLATTGWLRELACEFGAEEVGGVAGDVLPYPPETPAERYAARIRHLSPQRYLNRPLLPFAVTANLAFRRSVFTEIGCFDPDSPRGGESTDFCTRFFRRTGLELRFSPKAAVFHRHRATAGELVRQHWVYGRGNAFLHMKYRDEAPWGWHQTVFVYRDLARAGCALAAAAVSRVGSREKNDNLAFACFDCLGKAALRAGFLREVLAQRWYRP